MSATFLNPKHILRSNFNTRQINSRENYRFFGHNSEPCGNFWTILRHKLPIIHPDHPIPSNNLSSNVQPENLITLRPRGESKLALFSFGWLCSFVYNQIQSRRVSTVLNRHPVRIFQILSFQENDIRSAANTREYLSVLYKKWVQQLRLNVFI